MINNAAKKILLSVIIIALVIYLFFGIILFLFQKSLIYYPNNQEFNSCYGFSDYQKINFNGTRFYFRNVSDQVIVIYHGNAGSACDRSAYRELFETSNKSIIFVEYSGYSNSDNSPSKEIIFGDVYNINKFLRNNSFREITVFGESIGSGAASYHASIGNVNSLILVSPLSSLKEVAQSKFSIYPLSILLTEDYDNYKELSSYKGKLIIFHGDQDTVIPYKYSKEMYDKLSMVNKEYILIEGKGHNDMWSSASFQNRLAEVIKG